MKIALGLVGLVCLTILGELIYANPHDWLVIGLAIVAFVPYAVMVFGIIVSKKLRSRLLPEKE